jgi:hypothetical protein
LFVFTGTPDRFNVVVAPLLEVVVVEPPEMLVGAAGVQGDEPLQEAVVVAVVVPVLVET